MRTPVGVSTILVSFLLVVFTGVFLLNIRFFSFTEMEATKQRALVKAATANKKRKEKDGVSSSAPKGIIKGTLK